MLPAVAQGAIGITCRAGDERAMALLAALDDLPTRQRVAAERAFLTVLDGSCRTPIAGLAELNGERLDFTGMILRPDGTQAYDVVAAGLAAEAESLGQSAGHTLLNLAGESFLATAP
jgi:hydroxymethylbilane synthase